jgi:hypothetical protein
MKRLFGWLRKRTVAIAIQLITLFIAPCIYCFVQEAKFRRRGSRGAEQEGGNLA